MLIAITGKKGHGKNAVGSILAARLELHQDSFAAPIKEAARAWFGLSEVQVNGTVEEKETVDPRWGITPRSILQRLGTEVARSIHPDVWARAAVQRHQETMKGVWSGELVRARGTVLTDCRFVNEAKIIRETGGIVIGVTRGGIVENEFSSHASEVEVDEVLRTTTDYFIRNDGTLDELIIQVLALADELRHQ